MKVYKNLRENITRLKEDEKIKFKPFKIKMKLKNTDR